MNPRLHLPLRVAAVSAASAVIAVVAATPAGAADGGSGGNVKVVNTETVQVYTSPTGQVQTRRVYEQLALTGNGSVDLRNPISTDNLRNLDGFGGFTVKDGDQITRTTVSGKKQLRSVSDYHGTLPLDVSVAYKLDGRNVKPSDVVGKDGRLEVTYTVQNVTARAQEVTFGDGRGGTVTKTVQVPIPMVGSLTTTAPSSFTNVHSDAANMAGDGKGGTKLSFTMTLFPPIGSDTAVFGYTADIKDGIVPRAEVAALPVNPLESTTFKSAAGSYQGGADTGAQLADGAGQIDANLLKLRDGAGKLLAGLIRLRDGAGQLETGLTAEAVPGSHKLADGASRLDAGLGQINSGAQRLADGTGEAFAGSKKLGAGASKLSTGAGKASAGSARLASGARRLADGVVQLDGKLPALSGGVNALADGQTNLAAGLKDLYDGVEALPTTVKQQLAADPQYLALLASLQSIADGVGSVTDSPLTPTLLGGINAVDAGMRYPAGYASNDCYKALTGSTPTQCGAMDGVQFISSQLSKGATDLDQLKPLLQVLNGTSNTGAPCAGYPDYAPPPSPFPATPTPCQAVDTIYYALFGVSPAPDGAQAKVNKAALALLGITSDVDTKLLGKGLPAGTLGGLDKIRFGLSNGDPANCLAAKATATPADDCGIKEGALFLKTYGLPALTSGIAASISDALKTPIGVPTVGCDPTKTLRCAAAALAAGGGDLATGVDKLTDGVGLLKDGSGRLATGAGDLSDGLGRLATGSHRLSVGAGDLAEGLGQIDDGAGRLAAGTGQAKDGSAQLADGAGRLSTGLEDAANGSSRLAAGLEKAAGGAPKLRNGAQRLSDEGTKQLVKAGEGTAQNYGELYATMAAGAERADSESMAFGAPEGAIGLTAYSYVIEGDDGEGGRNWTRGVGGLAILGAGAGAFALRRRFV